MSPPDRSLKRSALKTTWGGGLSFLAAVKGVHKKTVGGLADDALAMANPFTCREALRCSDARLQDIMRCKDTWVPPLGFTTSVQSFSVSMYSRTSNTGFITNTLFTSSPIAETLHARALLCYCQVRAWRLRAAHVRSWTSFLALYDDGREFVLGFGDPTWVLSRA